MKTEFEKKKERHASGESTMSADSVSNYIPTPPDGGYGWVIVTVAFFIHVFVDGIAFTFGVFYMEFLNYFGGGSGKTALVGSLLAGFYLLTAPFASALINKFGPRCVSIAGGMLASLGFLLSTLSPNLDFLMFSYGVLGGIGLGLAYLPCIVSVSFYFQKRRAVATGIAVCGAGVGCFIFAPAGRMLLEVFDWKNAMLIVSGMVLNLCVCGALLRPLQPANHKRKPRAKNMLDRLVEQANRGMGRKRQESECSTCAYSVKDRVQEVKLMREQALKEEDTNSVYSIMPNSALNSVARLDRSDSYTPSRAGSITINRMDSIPGRGMRLSFGPAVSPTLESPTQVVPTILLEGQEQTAKHGDVLVSPSSANNTEIDIDELDEKTGILSKEGADSESAKGRSLIYKPGMKLSHSALDRVRLQGNGPPALNGSLPNGIATGEQPRKGVLKPTKNGLLKPDDFTERLQTGSTGLLPLKARNRKCPPGIHREDYARPMYRRDIFYSGSIVQIPEFQSQPNVDVYSKSVTTIPQADPFREPSQLCSCIPKSFKDTLADMMDVSLLKDPVFLIACLGNLFGAVGLFIPYIYIAERAIHYDIPETDAAFLLSVIGITNTIGRVLAGLVADMRWMNSLALHNAALLIGGVACILNIFCTGYASCCVFAAVFGLCVATWISLTSIILCDLLGIQKLTNAFGLLTMTRGFASIAGPPMAGMVYEATKDYNASFHVGGAMLIMAGLCCSMLHLPFFQCRAHCNQQSNAIDLDLPLPYDSDLDADDNDGLSDLVTPTSQTTSPV